ncbi:hypothetical protein KKB18_07835, partial [bacterium]|nr:hypothetical protein [bacterium]
MKKLLVFFTIVALMTLSIFAQWEELTHGDELLEEFSYLTYGTGFMLDVDNGWFVGDNGLIIKTTNGGATWTTLRDDDGSGLDWLDVQFYDANTGYACGEKGYILKTVDGGANWDMVGDTANYKENLLYLKVIDANTVFFAGENATLLKTGDGGVNFVKSDNTFEGLKLDGGIDFCNANVGVVASKDVGGYTWYTHDGGANWNLVDVNAESSPAPGQSTYSIQGVGAGGDSTIVLALKYRIILVSQDGGKSYTWKGDYTFANDYYYEASVIDKNTFFVSGNGLTVRTTDGGATWDSLAVGTAYRVMFMNFFDTNTGFVICEKNQWKKTTDGGDTFTPIIEWPDVDFRAVGATSSTIFVTGFNGGEITSSNDGGITWTWPTNEMTGAIGSLLKCEFYDDNNGITAGNGGQLYRTSDGGASWTLIYNPMYYIGKTIYTITYHSSDTVFAGGSSGYLMRSVDGGLTWSDTYLSGTTKSNYGILPLSGSTAIVCGASGYLYKAEFLDNSTVDDSLYNTFTDDDFNAVVSFGDSLILLTDEGAILKAAIDNLSTFKRIEIDAATDELNDIEFVNDTLVFVAGKSGKIYRSEDTGNTWTADTSPTTETIYDILYTNYALWGETNYGAIIKLDFTPPITELVGDYYIPKGSNAQGFATLGEAVTAANTLDVIGTVNFLLDADTLREASFTFNADLSAENNVVIKPASGRDVVLIVAPGVSKGNGPQMIGFDKGYVTIDGSNDGSDSRNLIITNEVVADVPIGLNTANADMVVLKNLIIKNLDNGVSNFKYGAVTNDVAGIEGFTVENCQIGSAEFPVWRDGVAVWGTSSGSTQGIVLNNDIYAGSRGIATYVVNDCNFSGNTIYMLPTTSATTYSYVHGIYLTGASGPMTIHGNTINCLEAATVSGTYIVGIAFAGNSEGAGEIISVVNNMVNVGAADGTHPTYGIGFRSANNMGNIQAYY